MPAKLKIIISISALAVFAATLLIFPETVLQGFSAIRSVFAAPTCDPSGTCSVLTTDGSGNFGIGANSDAVSRLFIKDADTSATKYGLKIVSSDGSTPVFVVRNDGAVSLASSTYVGGRLCFGTMGTGTDCVTSWSGVGGGVTSTPAGYVTPGYFNSVAGTGGNYSFPASLSVGTSTAPSGGVLFVNGNAGIGTKNPTAKLTIGPNVATAYLDTYGEYQLIVYDGSSAPASYGMGVKSSTLVFNSGAGAYSFDKAGVGTQMSIDVSGNVGIGKTPGVALDVYRSGETAAVGISSGIAGGSASLYMVSGSASDFSKIGYNSKLQIGTAATVGGTITTRMTIDGSGNVGIATTTPTYPLTVAGTIHSSTGGYRFPDGTTQTTAASGSGSNYFTLSGTSLYPTSTAYNVGIGTTSPGGGYKLTVAGGPMIIYATSSYTGLVINTLNSDGGYVGSGGMYSSMEFGLYGSNDEVIALFDTVGQKFYYGSGAIATEYGMGGKVGIGTASPGATLDVSGDFKLSGSSRRIYGDWGNATTANRPIFQSSVADNGTYVQTIPNGAGSASQFIASNSSDTTNFAYTAMAANASVSFLRSGVSGTGTQLPLVFQIGASEKMRIDTAGNIGIGTNAPEAKLHLVQDGTSYPPVYIDSYGTSAHIISRAAGGTLASPSATTNGQILGGFAARGRGTTAFSTGAKAGVLAYAAQTWTDSAQGTNILLYTTPNNSTTLTERMRITDAGNVGIATTTPTYPLTVAGTIHSSTGGYRFPDGTTQTSAGATYAGTGSFTGANYFLIAAGSGVYLRNGGGAPLQAFSNDGGGAYMSFHRGGAYAVNVGLDPDGSFAIGGWSDGAVNRIKIETTGNTTFGSTGTAKINVGTIDPPYTINGEQYATYLSGMIGQKEETTGEISLSCSSGKCSAKIDFEKQEKGSDLWLFAKTTNLKNNFSKLTVLLTPAFDGKVWYEKDTTNNVLKISASPAVSDKSSVNSYSVSYRLTAPRFDSAKWLNTRNDADVDGFIIND